jgi:hypothetical protein
LKHLFLASFLITIHSTAQAMLTAPPTNEPLDISIDKYAQIFYVPLYWIEHEFYPIVGNRIDQDFTNLIENDHPFVQLKSWASINPHNRVPCVSLHDRGFSTWHTGSEGLPLRWLIDKKASDIIKTERYTFVIEDNPETKQPFQQVLQERLDAFKKDPFHVTVKNQRPEYHYNRCLDSYIEKCAAYFCGKGIIEKNSDDTYTHGPNGYFALLKQQEKQRKQASRLLSHVALDTLRANPHQLLAVMRK